MVLKEISLLGFKNYEQSEAHFSHRVNCLTGPNGEGKTNVLDAIYYLAFCKSYFNPIDSQNIRHNDAFFMIQGLFSTEDGSTEIYCAQKRGQKKQFKKNKKEYERLADHIGYIPLVMISPYDSELIEGGSESRRKFIDSVISQYNKSYLEDLIYYNRALSQRNAQLKSFARNRTGSRSDIEVWDEQLAAYGEKIFAARRKFIESFIPIFNKYYQLISGGKEEVTVEYESKLFESNLKSLLYNNYEKDCRMEYTTAGIHKDDLAFQIASFPIKKYASQGQQKTYLLALKFAQYDFIKTVKGIKPLLLLDDIYDKLDDERVTSLMKLVSGNDFGQLFITDTNEERIANIFKKLDVPFKMFSVMAGKLNEVVPHE